jgi:hypothetical protein
MATGMGKAAAGHFEMSGAHSSRAILESFGHNSGAIAALAQSDMVAMG